MSLKGEDNLNKKTPLTLTIIGTILILIGIIVSPGEAVITTLTCTSSTEIENTQLSQKDIYLFSNNSLVKVQRVATIESVTEDEANIQLLDNKESINEFNQVDGYSGTINQDGTTVTIEWSFDIIEFNKLNESTDPEVLETVRGAFSNFHANRTKDDIMATTVDESKGIRCE